MRLCQLEPLLSIFVGSIRDWAMRERQQNKVDTVYGLV